MTAWLDALKLRESLGIEPGTPPQGASLAIRAFNMLQFAGLDQVADVLGYEDMELLVTQIETIRFHQARNHG